MLLHCKGAKQGFGICFNEVLSNLEDNGSRYVEYGSSKIHIPTLSPSDLMPRPGLQQSVEKRDKFHSPCLSFSSLLFSFYFVMLACVHNDQTCIAETAGQRCQDPGQDPNHYKTLCPRPGGIELGRPIEFGFSLH